MSQAQLAGVAAEIREVTAQAERLVARAGLSRLLERPTPQSWSAAECLEHLNITTRAFVPGWRSLCEEARRNRLTDPGKPFKTEFLSKTLIWFLEPPPKMRFPTPPKFIPVAIDQPDRVLPDFLTCQQQILDAIAFGEGLALDRIRIASPFNEKLHYSIWSSFRITASHERRHLWQAEKALERLAAG